MTEARLAAPARTAAVVGTLGLLAAVGAASGVALSRAPTQRATAEVVRERSATPAPIAPARNHGVIAIASVPPGAAIFVNGELSAQTTPVTFSHVALGTSYVITLAAPSCDSASRTVTLTEESPSGALGVVLQPHSAPDAR